MKNIPAAAVALALAAALFFPPAGYPAGLGDMAPDFTVETTEGRKISYFADIRGKKPLYLIFWATW